MKTLSWQARKKLRKHSNEMISLRKMMEEELETEEAVIKKIIAHPKGVMLWSNKTIDLFHDRCREDIVYVDATGSIVKKAKGKTSPFYVYEMVVRNPFKGSSPVPVATYITNDHTTASISFFLGSFLTDVIRLHGRGAKQRPVMLICDGSTVLMESMAYNFCGVSLQELLSRYYSIVTGQAKHDCIRLPIMHRCLSHVMKNAKDLCRKHAAKHYHLAMHVFGLMTQATTMSELDEVVTSAVVVFSSSHSDRNVGKHFENLQGLLTNSAQSNLDDSTIVEDCVNDIGPTPFKQHFEDLITQTVIEKSGDDNMYFCPTFIPSLLKYFLPLAGLWSGLLLGDLGRHGTGTIYQKLSQKYKSAAKKPTQNYTEDNKTQGIMEKSQWDLKKISFQRRRLTRLDDFVHTYKVTLSALLREYGDSLRRGKKTHRVDMERWKKRKQNRRGVYVTPINKPFVFRQHKKNLMLKTKTAKAPAPLQKQEPGETEAHIPSQDPKDKARQGQSSSTSDMTEHAEDDAQGGKVDASSEVRNCKDTSSGSSSNSKIID
ncbi:uncharacterized protein LOC117543645 isoform X1 [Gymnodraco acuticeps]|uniref:Uncharacterized protein LOC117543645 isoform X1 n=1 Tax=Gymnodraco acuticeps TaxID=8218 RepID=A0A6P8TUL1_GYMAC|nr:uncharacterized protein LOC117543645 isoform X1 [Gymnodraco acuticeps]XP_034067935.1 uncharacterized protein LOC117543645 isoform X1 [Gymnodraco acuticeps]